MNREDTLAISGDVAEQAMHWHLELQEPEVSEATLAAWMRWRQAHPVHEHAWQRAEVFARRMRDLRSPDQRPSPTPPCDPRCHGVRRSSS